MPDTLSSEQRSKLMSNIRSKDTKPELIIRSGLHKLGYRFRLHVKDLPGKPDIVLPRYRTAIQVRGCFWHGHSCKDGHVPKSRKSYWVPKLEKTKIRDKNNDKSLEQMGWIVIVIWACECDTAIKAQSSLSRIAHAMG